MPKKGTYGFYSKRTPYTRQYDEIAKYGDTLDLEKRKMDLAEAEAKKKKKESRKEPEMDMDYSKIPSQWAANTLKIQSDVSKIFQDSYEDQTLTDGQRAKIQTSAETQPAILKALYDEYNQTVELLSGEKGNFMDLNKKEDYLLGLRDFIEGNYDVDLYYDTDSEMINMRFYGQSPVGGKRDPETGEVTQYAEGQETYMDIHDMRKYLEHVQDDVEVSQGIKERFDRASATNGYFANPNALLEMTSQGWTVKPLYGSPDEAQDPARYNEVYNTYLSSFDSEQLPPGYDDRDLIQEMYDRDRQRAQALAAELNYELGKNTDEPNSFYEYENIVPQTLTNSDGTFAGFEVAVEKNKGQNADKTITLEMWDEESQSMKAVTGVMKWARYNGSMEPTSVRINLLKSADQIAELQRSGQLNGNYAPILSGTYEEIFLQPGESNMSTVKTHLFMITRRMKGMVGGTVTEEQMVNEPETEAQKEAALDAEADALLNELYGNNTGE